MNKIKQMFMHQSQKIQQSFIQQQQKFNDNFDRFINRQNDKKERLIQKLNDANIKLQNIMNPVKKDQQVEKIKALELQIQQLERKEQRARDFHIVYDGLMQQLQLCAQDNIQQLSQQQKNENYVILCSIKRQALNIRSQLYKRKPISIMNQLVIQTNEQLKQYLNCGIDKQFEQIGILELGIEQLKQDEKKFQLQDQQFNNNNDFQEQKKYYKSQYDKQDKQYYKQNAQQYNKKNESAVIYQKKGQNNNNEIINNQQLQENNEQSQIIINQQKLIDNQSKQEQQEDQNLCQICFENPKSYVAVPCGHFVYCQICKDLVNKQCLICRADVVQLLKIFQ